MPNKGGFSLKTLLGITKIKQNISRKTGVPLTKSGRQRKIGAIITKNCCCSTIAYGFLIILGLIFFLVIYL